MNSMLEGLPAREKKGQHRSTVLMPCGTLESNVRRTGTVSINVLVLGESGTGKTSSLRNLPQDKTAIIKTIAKPMPFRGSNWRMIVCDHFDGIVNAMHRASQWAEAIVIDDAQYMLANEFFARSAEKGYDKFNDIGSHGVRLIQESMKLPNHIRVYMLWHTEFTEQGREKAKTSGKAIDSKYTVEGAFTICVKAVVHEGQYYFSTKSNGFDTVKTPIGMFSDDERFVPNDLQEVDRKIVEYYGLSVPVKEDVQNG